MKPLLLTLTFLCGASLSLLPQDNKILTFAEAKAQADQGDAFAEAVVAFHYTLGWQTEKNLELAVQYAKSSAEKKNPFGLFRLGALTLAGEGVEKNEKEGLELQDESLVGLNEMEGNPYSITALGVALFQGKVLDQDQETAAKLYKKAADLGYAPAQYNYANCAESGQGIPKNLAVSKAYLQKAAAQNFPLALSGAAGIVASTAKVGSPSGTLNYDSDKNALRGTVALKVFPGPPSFESIENGDKPMKVFILTLDSPVDVPASKVDDSLDVAEENIEEVHLVLSEANPALDGKRVEVKGGIFHSHTGYHCAKILMNVKKLTELGGAKESAAATISDYKALDTELNAVYKKIRSLLPPENQTKLKNWQMGWVKNNEYLAQKAGSSADKEKILTASTRERLDELQALLLAVEEDPERELDFEDENAGSRHINANGLNALFARNLPEDSLRITLGLTLPPGVFYSGRDIRGMWPEVNFTNPETNQKLLVCKFSEPEEGNSVETISTWHNGYYLSPDGSFAIVEAMDEEAFHSDGAQGQSCYYVYNLPALAEIPRTFSKGSGPKEINLKPAKTLSKAQLAKAYPDISAPTESNSDSESEDSASGAESETTETQGLAIPTEFVGTWDSRPLSEESQVVITKNEIRFYLGEVVGKFTKITRTGPNQVVCEIDCKEIEETWKDKTTLTLLAGGKQLKVNKADKPLYRAK